MSTMASIASNGMNGAGGSATSKDRKPSKQVAPQAYAQAQQQAADALPKAFVESLRVLFDILDEDKDGLVPFVEIKERWQSENSPNGLPAGVIESLRKVAPKNGQLSFERFCTGLRLALYKGRFPPAGSPKDAKKQHSGPTTATVRPSVVHPMRTKSAPQLKDVKDPRVRSMSENDTLKPHPSKYNNMSKQQARKQHRYSTGNYENYHEHRNGDADKSVIYEHYGPNRNRDRIVSDSRDEKKRNHVHFGPPSNKTGIDSRGDKNIIYERYAPRDGKPATNGHMNGHINGDRPVPPRRSGGKGHFIHTNGTVGTNIKPVNRTTTKERSPEDSGPVGLATRKDVPPNPYDHSDYMDYADLYHSPIPKKPERMSRGRAMSPSSKPSSPPSPPRRAMSPPRRAMSPPTRPLSPSARPMSPTRPVSPRTIATTTTTTMSPKLEQEQRRRSRSRERKAVPRQLQYESDTGFAGPSKAGLKEPARAKSPERKHGKHNIFCCSVNFHVIFIINPA